MSKNYELLQNVPLDGQAPTFTTGTNATAETVSVPGTAHAAQVLPIAGPEIRKEVLKLVQRLFLIPQEKPPKAVVFAGIDAHAPAAGPAGDPQGDALANRITDQNRTFPWL